MGVVWASGHAMGIGLNSSSFLFSLLSHFDQQTSRRPVEGIIPAFFKDLCVSSTLAHIFKTGKNPAVKTSGVCNNSAQGMIRKTHIKLYKKGYKNFMVYVCKTFLRPSEVYNAKDTELLLSIPIKARDIVLSRVSSVLRSTQRVVR